MQARQSRVGAAVMVSAALVLVGCVSEVSRWVRPNAAPITRLAVLPFDNQTPAIRAGAVASELLVAELLAAGGVAVMDPGEAADLLRRENFDPADAARRPSAQRVGRLLRVTHVLEGSVVEYRYKPGISETPVVGLTARVIDVATGEAVWTASETRARGGFFYEDGLARVAQSIVRDMARHLTGALSSDRGR